MRLNHPQRLLTAARDAAFGLFLVAAAGFSLAHSPAGAMQRVANGTQLPTQPTVGSTTGTPGFFGKTADGSPGPTVVDRDFMNSLQETVINPITSAGITLSGTDNTQLTGAINFLGHHITGASGTARDLIYQSAGVDRWRLETNSTTESGSNVGSDLDLRRYSDAGSYVDTVLHMVRSTGVVAFTYSPTLPTASFGDSSAKGASTAFVAAAVAPLAPLASPALTGSPTAPTQTTGDNTTKIATDAFVLANLPSLAPAFASSSLSVSSNSITATHSLGRNPYYVQVVLVCVSPDDGYSAGDRVVLPATSYTGQAGGVAAFVGVWYNSTTVGVSFSSYTNIAVPSKTGGTGTYLTPGDWNAVLEAW